MELVVFYLYLHHTNYQFLYRRMRIRVYQS